ncbi:MAG: hypothetical protein KH828_05780 [Clostridiales bacterium]|nr:hypothetical protein [Clostridiales bacterium]
MGKKHNLKPLKELNLTDRFLFDEVMEDPQIHQDVLSIIFGKEIPLLEKNETESQRIRRIHNRVCEVKANEQVGVKYMQAWEEKYYELEEAKEEGAYVKLKEQIKKKLQKNKTAEEIADALEETVETIETLISEINSEI